MTTDMLSVKGGTKIFYRGTQDERRALDGLDVALKPGRFLHRHWQQWRWQVEFSQCCLRQAAAGLGPHLH